MTITDPTSIRIASEDLDDRLARLEARIDKEERSPQKRVAAYGGLIALLISILTGSLSIHNAFFVAPDLERRAQAQRLSSAIQEHNARSAEVNSLPMSAPPEQRYAAAIGLNNARAALVAELRASEWETLSRLSSPDLGASAWAIAESDEFDLSQRLAQLAVEKSSGFPERAAAMNTLARTTLISNNDEGRKLYDSFFKEILAETSVWRWSSYTAAATTETHVLAVTGRCDDFSRRVEWHLVTLKKMRADQSNSRMFMMAANANRTLCEGAK